MRFIYTKRFSIYFGFFVAICLVIFLYYKNSLHPLQKLVLQIPRPINFFVGYVVSPTKHFFKTIFTLKEIANENLELKEKVIALQNKQVLFDQLSLENEQLRTELKFVRKTNLSLEPCVIIARSTAGLLDTITINCGEEKGSEVGRAVIFKGYLVGKIIYSTKDFSIAQLITNSNFSIDVKISSSGGLSIVKGSFNSGIVIDQVSEREALEKGSLVVTAGLNDKIPKDILIGEVDEVLSQPNDLFKKASLISPVDFGNLELVFLVK